MNLLKYKVIFWDFDGVIKESHTVKTDLFTSLFQGEDSKLIERVAKHHKENGGLSRHEKLPIYLKWLGRDSQENIENYIKKFEALVVEKVVNSKWVPGSKEYIIENHSNQTFYILTGTPQYEIKKILERLDFIDKFKDYFGSPNNKIQVINKLLKDKNIDPRDCIMIGDAQIDFEAAKRNNIDFLLRTHNENADIFIDYKGMKIKDFIF